MAVFKDNSESIGKTPLILINRLEEPSGGRIEIDGEDVTALDATGLRRFRQQVGMIFQHFNLLSSKTVADNVALPLKLAGELPRSAISARVAVVLAVALSPGHRLAAEGRVVQGDGPKADPAGPAQVHAVAGLQPAGEGDKQFAISCQGADEPLFPGLKVLIVSPIQRDYIGIHNNAPDGE